MRPLLMICLLTILFAGTLDAQWTQTSLDSVSVTCFGVSNTNLYAGTLLRGVFLSTNNGASWTAVNDGIPKTPSDTTFYFLVQTLAVNDTDIFAGILRGVWLSTNNGTSWTHAGLAGTDVQVLAVSGDNLFAGTTHGVYRSTDNGTSWTEVNTGLDFGFVTDRWVNSLCVSSNGSAGTNLYIGTGWCEREICTGGVFLSTNGGASWDIISPSDWAVDVVAATPDELGGMNVFAAGREGVFKSSDNGAHWTEVDSSLTNRSISTFVFSPNGKGGVNLFAGTYRWDWEPTYTGGVFLSTNYGTSWTQFDEGLPSSFGNHVYTLAVSPPDSSGPGYLFAGVQYEGIWRRPLSDVIASIDPENGESPSEFTLFQNYPNPFNPTTVISYQLPGVSNVKLVVYDLLGREVSVLVNERKNAGSYEVQFDASGLASGVYVFRLTAGSFVQSRKMVLVR